jgi:translocation and assembly module TamB
MARRYRILIAAAALLLGLPIVLCMAVLVLANTDYGRRLIESNTARLTDGGVLLQGLAGRFPDRLRLARLELRDPQGLWLEADELQLNWWPLPLIRRHARVDLLQAARLHIERAPAYPARVPPRPSSGLWLRRLRVDKLDIQRLELGAALAGNAVALRLQGVASITSWQQASGQLTAQRLDDVPATYRVLLHIDSARVRGQLDLEEDANGPLTHLIQLPDLGALSAHVTLDGPREAVTTQLSLHAGALQGEVHGTLNLNARAAALQVALDASAMSPRPDLSWQQLSLHGSWNGTLAAPSSSAQLALAGLAWGPVQLAALSAGLRGEGDALALDASLSGLVLPKPFLGMLASAPVQLQAKLRLADPARPADITLSHPLLDAQGRWSMAAGNASLSATFKDIGPLARLADVGLTGRGTLRAQLTSSAQTRRVEFNAGIDVADGDAPLVALLAPHAMVSAALLFKDGGLEIQRSQFDASKLQASLHGRQAPAGTALDFKFALPDLAVLSPTLAGEISGQGQLQGLAPRLVLAADVSGKLSEHGNSPGPLRLSLRARDLPQHPNGRIELTGTLDQAELQLAASVERSDDGTMSARIERGEWKSARLAGALRVDNKAADPQGRLELHFEHLQDLDRLLGQDIQGGVDASVVFDRAAGHSRALVTLDARDAGLPAQQLQLLQVRGEIAEPLLRPVLALQVTAQGLRGGALAKLSTEVHGPIERLQLHTLASIAVGTDPVLHLDAAATLRPERHDVRLTALRADYRDQTLRLLAPASISFGDGIVLGQMRVGAADTVLQAAGRLTPTLDLTASLRDFTPSVLRVLWPELKGEGHADADAELTGTLAVPLGSLHVAARGLRSINGAARGLPATDIDANAQLQHEVVQVEVRVHAGEGLQLTGKGQVPLNRDATMAFKVNGEFNLNVVNPIIEASGQRLLGKATIDAELAGTPAAPQARGTLVVSGGDIQDYARGTHLSDVSGTLEADGEQLQLKQFTAHGGKGTITASGTLGLGGGDLPVALQVTARGARPFASDLLTATIDMDLKINGGLRSELNAAGKVQIDRADITIPNALPPDVAVLNVVRAGQKPAPVVKSSALIVTLDLTLAAPRAVFVRGRGLDTEMGGQLHIGGDNNNPDISGGFDLRNGTVNLAGATLTFNSGRVAFNGTGVRKKVDPTLDFTSTNTSGNGTATLNVGGYADAPVITLSSIPEMPQDEILARLLFGVSVTQLTPLQLAQIGAALATMGGVGGGGHFNPINAVQRKLGLDRLNIGGGSSNNGAATGTPGETSNAATIEAGRYVTRRVYIGGKQSTNGTTQAQVQVDLTKSLKLQTTLGTGGTVQGATPQNDPGSSVGLTYQFEY